MATPTKELRKPGGGYDPREVKTVHDWIELLKAEGEFREVNAKVDWDCEIGPIARYCMSAKNGVALLFDNIKGHSDTFCTKLFTNSISSYGRFNLAFGLPKDATTRELVLTMKEAYKRSISPKEVSTAPLKQNIIKGKDIDIEQIPVPKWHLWDGGRFINTFSPVITRDPDVGRYNMGIYRGMNAGPRHVSCLMAPSQGWGDHYSKARQRQEPMKVAFIYGCNPLLTILAGSAFGRLVSEYDAYGGIVGEPLELVQCETSDLLVPASAEMVIEGTMSWDPKDYKMEGPFAEHCGYYGGDGGCLHHFTFQLRSGLESTGTVRCSRSQRRLDESGRSVFHDLRSDSGELSPSSQAGRFRHLGNVVCQLGIQECDGG
jgi:4-hydroxy-3-polyprenylbenzoate decarboxylase